MSDVVHVCPRVDTAHMDPDNSLSNQLLIAMPGMADPNFNSTVTLICEHNDEGALGIVINRLSGLNMGGLFRQLAVEEADEEAASPRSPPAAH